MTSKLKNLQKKGNVFVSLFVCLFLGTWMTSLLLEKQEYRNKRPDCAESFSFVIIQADSQHAAVQRKGSKHCLKSETKELTQHSAHISIACFHL